MEKTDKMKNKNKQICDKNNKIKTKESKEIMWKYF